MSEHEDQRPDSAPSPRAIRPGRRREIDTPSSELHDLPEDCTCSAEYGQTHIEPCKYSGLRGGYENDDDPA
ncbi:hypothetical protein [Thermomonospora echinospora]|uniref:hypothetical protein n=1 Tax=Thermomonospora echinospora TaxID=1992 RepID=UPI0011AFF685|nr:hypothetical protein [Thermomonospora echinospora]